MRFYALFCAFAASLSIAVLAQAQTAPGGFSRWERVTPAEILKPVPEAYVYSPGGYGAVTNDYKRKPETKPCPIVDEKGNIIGYLDSCRGSR